MNLADPQERSVAAGEYVLGTLSPHDQATFALALSRDVQLRAEAGWWQDRLLGLTRQAAPANPSARLWQRIESNLPQTPAQAMAAKPAHVPARAPLRVPFWQRLAVWQSLSAITVAASLLLARALVLTGDRGGDRFVAVLQSPGTQTAGWVVEVQAGGSLRLLPTSDSGSVPPGRAFQFWTKPEGAAGPTSLGLVRAGQQVDLPASRLPALGERQLFEITLEPEAGSPIGRPTGPVLFVGKTVRL